MTDEIWVVAWVNKIMKIKADLNKFKGITLIELMIAVAIARSMATNR